jgi:hypothetical protein
VAHLIFGPGPPSLADVVFEDWARDAIRHAVTMTGASTSPEEEAFLGALWHRATAGQPTWARRVRDRVRAVGSCLPPEIPVAEVVSVLVMLDAEALRVIASVLAWVLAQIGRRMRAINAAQRQMERLDLSPRSTTVVREEAAAALAELARVRARYASTHRLIQRLAPPTREAVITPEARQLFEQVTQAGLSKRQAYRLIAAVLRAWHGLPDHVLTGAHIAARLQARAKPFPPVETARD